MFHPDNSQRVGTTIGGVVGLFKLQFVTLNSLVNSPQFDIILNTAIGATVGFIVTTFWRWLWEKFKRRKKK